MVLEQHGQEFYLTIQSFHQCASLVFVKLFFFYQFLPLIKSLYLENHLTNVWAPLEEIENEDGKKEVNPSYTII